MVSYDDTVTSLTDLKQNYAYSDDETDAQDNILREKLRMWHKITRLSVSGGISIEVNQNAELTLASSLSAATSAGYRFLANSDCSLVSLTKTALCTATRGMLKTDTGNTIIASATFSGNTATFSSPQALTAGTYYRLETDNSGLTYTIYRNLSPAYPYNNTHINFTTGSAGGTTTTGAYNIVSAVISYTAPGPSTESAVILPFNTLYEPFYTVDDVDYTTTVIPIPESTETAETTYPTTSNTINSLGYRIYVNTTCRLKSITRKSGCTAVRATLKTDTGNTILAVANYSGDTATLSEPYTLMAGTYYKIESDSSGSTYTYKGRTTGQAYPYNNTYVNYTLGSSNGGNTSVAYNVESIQVYTGEETTEESTTAVYDSTNEYFRFYTDVNGCYDTLTSKTISLRYNSRLKSISTTVYAKDTSGNPVNDGFDLQLYNGQEWFNIGNGTEVETIDIDGSDLDADLDADLSRRIINFDTDNTILFQNNIKYRIHYTGTDELIVYKVLIKLYFY